MEPGRQGDFQHRGLFPSTWRGPRTPPSIPRTARPAFAALTFVGDDAVADLLEDLRQAGRAGHLQVLFGRGQPPRPHRAGGLQGGELRHEDIWKRAGEGRREALSVRGSQRESGSAACGRVLGVAPGCLSVRLEGNQRQALGGGKGK